jgi:hypothetical protein
MAEIETSDLYQDVLAMVKNLSEKEQIKLLEELPAVCPWDCDSCHDEDCPCDRLGCAGSEAPRNPVT